MTLGLAPKGRHVDSVRYTSEKGAIHNRSNGFQLTPYTSSARIKARPGYMLGRKQARPIYTPFQMPLIIVAFYRVKSDLCSIQSINIWSMGTLFK